MCIFVYVIHANLLTLQCAMMQIRILYIFTTFLFKFLLNYKLLCY